LGITESLGFLDKDTMNRKRIDLFNPHLVFGDGKNKINETNKTIMERTLHSRKE
jgi:hypothetical protein